MFTLLFPVGDYLPLILEKLGLPEVQYRETEDVFVGVNLCTAIVYCSKDQSQFRMFCSSSLDGPISAKNLAIAAAIQHLKQAYCFTIVDMNHRELAELKGITIDPTPMHLTQVSPLINDNFDPDTFVDFCVAEKIALNSSLHPTDSQQNLAAAASLILVGESSSPVGDPFIPPYNNKPQLDWSVPKKMKTEAIPTAATPKITCSPAPVDCLQELKDLQWKVGLLQRQNAKLQTDVLDYKLKSINFQQSKSKFMRQARSFVEFYIRHEAADNLHSQLGAGRGTEGDTTILN